MAGIVDANVDFKENDFGVATWAARRSVFSY
jgi:hypothetical protein